VGLDLTRTDRAHTIAALDSPDMHIALPGYGPCRAMGTNHITKKQKQNKKQNL